MGQYFNAVILSQATEKAEVIAGYRPWDHANNGACITEHAWIGNDFVSTVEAILCPYGKYYGRRLVWAGDYNSPEPGMEENIFKLSKKILEVTPVVRLRDEFRYLVNHSKGLYVDKTKTLADAKGWQVHPLPILTAESDEGGGGDYQPQTPEQKAAYGTWARDLITVERIIPPGFTELIISF